MKTKVKVFTIVGMVMLLTSGIIAQNSEKKFGFEINGGASIATKELSNTRLNAGGGFEFLLHYRFVPHLGAYAGWGWNKLPADNSFAGDDICFEETGYIFGFQLMHPIGNSPFSYYARVGGLYNHIETENAEGDIINDTGHGLGFQLASGVNYYLGKNWNLTGGVKFNSLSRDADFEGISKNLDYQYVSIRIGFVKQF
ncbi:outer membrane beta-barrel protein [Thermophagus sp. OGC60D27]|uniref:outer membrane beta-barrel protein n=1 Tax=Thermophagus sp. OGC60D27 TaxID=3458415 RepID=UPI004037B397